MSRQEGGGAAPGAEVVGCVTDEVARIRAERVRIVGNDCCHGSDPACAAGCIFAEAVRNIISNVEPEPERAGEREFVRLMGDTFRRLDTETLIDDSAEEAWATATTDIKRLGRWLREGSPFCAELVEDIIESLFETRFYLDHDPDEVRAGGAVAKSRFVARVFADEILAPWRAGTDKTRKTFARFQEIDRAGEDRKEKLWDFIMSRCSWIRFYFDNRDVRGRINDLIVYLFRLYGMLAEQGVEALAAPGVEPVDLTHEALFAAYEVLNEEVGCDCGTDEPGTCALCLVEAVLASPPSERAGPKPEPIGRCADCGSHETPVGEYPLTSCISCGAPWRNYAREERARERETALREALEEIAAFGCGWGRSNVNPCTKRYASRKEWCAPCIARRALAAAPAPSGGETR